jgi:ATP:ADP antiporter, AAA family
VSAPAAGERRRVALLAAAVHFLILTAYYALRPLRDALALTSGSDRLPWLFSATFAALVVCTPALGFLAARVSRPRLVALIDQGSVAIFALLFALMQTELRALAIQVFFVWLSVFTVIVLSLFWSVAADRFREHEARETYGLIAAGGSLGALVGPLVTLGAATLDDPTILLLVSAGLLEAAYLLGRPLWRTETSTDAEPLGGSALQGISEVARSPMLRLVCVYLLLGSIAGTFGYFEQGRILERDLPGEAARTRLLAEVDFGVNALALVIQTFVTARLFSRLGISFALASVAWVGALGFVGLALAPGVAAVAAFQISRRAVEFAVAKPARELLFTRTTRSERYRAKSFIDTVVFRGGDALAGWMFQGLVALALDLRALALVAVPLALGGAVLGRRIGRLHERAGG